MTKRVSPPFRFDDEEAIVDLFAGGGGASVGIEMAIGRGPDIAINHDSEAIAMHRANHQNTLHFISDVFELNPHNVAVGRPVGLLWLSPDCKHFSKAKGGKPKSKKIRSLAWIGVRWARAKRPRVIILENVEEFREWGPLKCDGSVCELRKGKTFRLFVSSLERLGYRVEWRELRACDYGAPTIRKRLFLIARRDGEPIVWPEPTHADPKSEAVRSGRLKPWRAVAECIDFSLPTPSIFLTKEEGRKLGVRRPLSEKTMERIAKGIKRFVIDNERPYVVGESANFMTEHANGSNQRIFDVDEPMRTQMASVKGGHFALVTAFMAQHNLGNTGRDMLEPMSTVTTKGSQQQLVTSHIMKMRNNNIGSAADEPIHSITAGGLHHAEVRAFLVKYYGTGSGQSMTEPAHTVTTKDRLGIVTVRGEEYRIVDIGMRMLTPRELFRAQGFPEDYRIDVEVDGRKISKTAQVRMCGNSVCPPIAAALVRANYRQMSVSADSELSGAAG